MWIRYVKLVNIFSTLLVILVGCSAKADGNLGLTQYLDQVKSKNGLYRGSEETAEGALHQSHEADLAFTPKLFASAQTGVDSKIPSVPLFLYKELDSQNYSIGISEQFSFGPEVKLSYQADYTSYVNPNLSGFDQNFYDVRPVLELSMPILKNGFGIGARAEQSLLRAQSENDSYQFLAQSQQTILDAETAYWRLSVAGELLVIEHQALDQSQKIFDNVAQKARMNLADQSDSLQAEAAYRSRQIELRRAENEQRAALRAFNALRGEASDTPVGALDPIPSVELKGWSIGEQRPGDRADVKAAEANSRVTKASATLSAERNRPTLDLFANYALNGRNSQINDAFSDSYHADRPTAAIGVKFSVPILYGVMDEARQGALQKAEAAGGIYEQKQVDQEKDWRDLVVGLKDAQETYDLSVQVEEAQKRKVENERKLLKLGRSTTFQVLQFEQDYSQSELYRVQAAYQIITIKNQSKLYAQTSGGSK